MASKKQLQFLAHGLLSGGILAATGATGWLIEWHPIFGLGIAASFLGGWWSGLTLLGPDILDGTSDMSRRWRLVWLAWIWKPYRWMLRECPELGWPFVDGLTKILILVSAAGFVTLPLAFFRIAPIGAWIIWMLLTHPAQCVLFYLGLELSNALSRLLILIEEAEAHQQSLQEPPALLLIKQAIATSDAVVVGDRCEACNTTFDGLRDRPFDPEFHAPQCPLIQTRRAALEVLYLIASSHVQNP